VPKDPAIVVSKVSKDFKLPHEKHSGLKQAILSFGGDKGYELQHVLHDISFKIQRGDFFAIVGRNGSGKSTLLKLLAGIYHPSSGDISVHGKLVPFIELGVGFNPELTGRENVFLNAAILGFSQKETEAMYRDIVDFAELRDFIDAPVKTYSSGMYMRLGFAVAIHVDPDVLLFDEVLAVGDESFTDKCLDKFGEFHRRGRTVLIVTHSLSLVERLCDEAVWLDAGEKQSEGDPKRVVGAYLTAVDQAEKHQMAATTAKALQTARPSAPAGDMFQATEGRWGSREIEITDVELMDANGQPSFGFQTTDPVSIRFRVKSPQPVDDFVFGIGVFNADGVCCFGTNTSIEDMTPDRIDGDGQVTFAIDSLDLVEGTYKLDVAVHRRDGAPYDYHRLLYTFRVQSRTHDTGVFRPKHRWAFSPTVRFK